VKRILALSLIHNQLSNTIHANISSMEDILIPSTIEFEEDAASHYGTVVITPCHHGYGTTLANALRRVLLSSLPGAAVTAVRIKGAQHEFSTIEGVKEDAIEICLNLKELNLKCFSTDEVVLHLKKKGEGSVTAADIEANADVEIINGDQHILTLTDKNASVDMEIVVKQGRGYVPVEENEDKNLPLGTIAIDAIYTPVKDVGYKIEATRVGDITNYEKLSITVQTDGTISVKDAVTQAVQILNNHFSAISEAAGK